MKTTAKQIKVSSSYRMVRRTETMEPAFALAAVRSDNVCRYGSAVLNDDHSVTLTSYDVICPYCNCVQPIRRHNRVMQWHIDTMNDWANPQLTLFPQEHTNTALTFFSPELHQYCCPQCKRQSDNKNKGTTIWAMPQKNKVAIRTEIKDLRSIFNLPYWPCKVFSIEFPLYEQIEFNFRNGHTCVRVMTNNDRILHTVDITNAPSVLSECELTERFYKHEPVKQTIIECFQSVSKSVIPIEPSDIILEDFVFLTRFTGFDKAFYAAIPYDKETFVIDRSFRNLEKLHTSKTAVDYLAAFAFAKCKSTRKQIWEQSGLLFYLPECEILFRAIGDVNVFRSILETKYAFDILLTLHEHPVSSEFFVDYCKLKGAANLFRKINSSKYSWFDFRWYVLNYCSLSQYGKSLEHKKWKTKASSAFTDRGNPTSCSLPLMQSSPKEAKCVIGGFSFKPLRNTSECFKASQELRNCLRDWESHDPVVIAVVFENELVAAFEILNNAIAQARTYENGSIDEIEGLPEAIDKWAQRNSIHCSTGELIEGW